MSDDLLHDFEAWYSAVLQPLQPTARRHVLRDIARELRHSQQQRIADQKNPDGSPYAPRRRKLRTKTGRIKRRQAMFGKLRRSKYLRYRASTEAATVYFHGHAAKIARVSQYGLVDAVRPGGKRVRYPRRELLGFTHADREMVRDLIMDHLTP